MPRTLLVNGSDICQRNNKQLLDEAEHDIKNYSDRGRCYLPKRS